MNRYRTCLNSVFIALLILVISCTSNNRDEKVYGKATLQLIDLVEGNPEVKSLVEASIAKAKEVNPDRETNPVQTLEEYYDFVSWAETSMPWALLKKTQFPDMYNNILQSICYFYFLKYLPHDLLNS